MKIATVNINNVNKRLPNLLGWLGPPDVLAFLNFLAAARRRSPLAICTISELISAWLLRPSHLPAVSRLRSRAALSFATKVVNMEKRRDQ